MKAVTIALGDDYVFYAKVAAERMKKYTGLDTIVLTDEHKKEVKGHPIFQISNQEKGQACFLKYFVYDLYPELDDILYYDTDYCCTNYWVPSTVYDGRFTAVRDRTAEVFKYPKIDSWVMNYFNAGFYIANKKDHQSLFELCKKHAHEVRKQWTDQCVTNCLVNAHKVPVRFLDKRYNVMDIGPALLASGPMAVHTSGNYSHYRKGTAIAPEESRWHWDIIRMDLDAGLANVKFLDDKLQKCLYLFPDGTTSEGHIWFHTKEGKTVFCDIKGENPRFAVIQRH